MAGVECGGRGGMWGCLALPAGGRKDLTRCGLWVGLPRVSLQLVGCHSFLEVLKVRVPVALGNRALPSSVREELRFIGMLTKYYGTFFFLVYCKVNFFFPYKSCFLSKAKDLDS